MNGIIYTDHTLSNYYHTDKFSVPTNLVFYYKGYKGYNGCKCLMFKYDFKDRYWESGVKRKPWSNIDKLTITKIRDEDFKSLGNESFLTETNKRSPFYNNVMNDIKNHIRVERIGKLKDLEL